MSGGDQANGWNDVQASAISPVELSDSADGRQSYDGQANPDPGANVTGPRCRDQDENGRERPWSHHLPSTKLLQVLAVIVIVMTMTISPGLVGGSSNSPAGVKILRGMGSYAGPTPSEHSSAPTYGTSAATSTTSTLSSLPTPVSVTKTGVTSAGSTRSSAGQTATASANPGAAPIGHTFGITMPGVPSNLDALQSLSALLGTSPGIDMWYEQWSSDSDFPAAAASTITQSGATPEITWEPWNPADGVTQPAYSLSAITAGNYDSYITTWAEEIRAWGHPLMLRFAEEMNGNWTPWDEGVNGNGPGSFVAAWDHVHALFTSAGADNVTWVWSPSVVWSTSTPLSKLWPGNSYVNAVALDGYNWGPLHPDSGWQTFSQIFQESIDQVQQLTQDPLYIGEVASTELGGNKAAWITDMFATLEASPEIKGFVWFDYQKETDWPIDSSPASLAAFRAGLTTYDSSAP